MSILRSKYPSYSRYFFLIARINNESSHWKIIKAHVNKIIGKYFVVVRKFIHIARAVAVLHAFFISKSFISNARLKLANFCYLKIIHILYPHYHPKILGHTLKKKNKSVNGCIYEIIRVFMTKMKMKMKNRSHMT